MSETLTTVIEHEAFARLYRDELAQEGLEIEMVDLEKIPVTTVSIFPEFSQLVKACAPALRDLIDGEKYARDFPLFVGQGLLDEKAPAAQTIVQEGLLAGLPERLRRAADEAISLYRFFENKPGVSFAPVFTALLGAVDECAKGLVIQKLSPHLPTNQVDQQDWFSPYLGKVDQRMRRHYDELGRNLRKTLVYRSGVSPLGMLRSCLDYALNDSTQIEGIFDTIKSSLRFSGGRELLDQVTRLNDFRNTCVAHQQNPLLDAHTAKKALVDWIDAIGKLWRAAANA